MVLHLAASITSSVSITNCGVTMTSGDKKCADAFEPAGVIEDYRGVMGGPGKRTNGVGQDGSVLTLKKSMADMKVRLFDHIFHQTACKKTNAGEDGTQAAKGQTGNDLFPGFEIDKVGHRGCITTGDQSGNHRSHYSADSATS